MNKEADVILTHSHQPRQDYKKGDVLSTEMTLKVYWGGSTKKTTWEYYERLVK